MRNIQGDVGDSAGCPVDHEAIKHQPEWSLLRFRGLQDAFDGKGTMLELRNCSCGTTLARLATRVEVELDQARRELKLHTMGAVL